VADAGETPQPVGSRTQGGDGQVQGGDVGGPGAYPELGADLGQLVQERGPGDGTDRASGGTGISRGVDGGAGCRPTAHCLQTRSTSSMGDRGWVVRTVTASRRHGHLGHRPGRDPGTGFASWNSTAPLPSRTDVAHPWPPPQGSHRARSLTGSLPGLSHPAQDSNQPDRPFGRGGGLVEVRFQYCSKVCILRSGGRPRSEGLRQTAVLRKVQALTLRPQVLVA
jgi:hypothetical protein